MHEEKDYVEGEIVTDLAVTKNQAQISVRHEISPEQFRADIANRKQLKAILLEYVRSELKEGQHYYYASKFGKDNPLSIKPKEGEKPSLNKEGALNVCHTLRCFPGQTTYDIRRDADGHITVYADAQILNADGVMIATSRGSCSTRESKYAYRWVSDNQVPADVDKSTLKSRGGTNRGGGNWKQYQLPNPDLADLENTVIKMADKRALKGAVDKLPIVSDIFAPPADDDNVPPIVDETPEPKPATKKAKETAAEETATPTDPAESKLADLFEAALARYNDCKDDERTRANKWLGSKTIRQLDAEGLTAFLAEFPA